MRVVFVFSLLIVYLGVYMGYLTSSGSIARYPFLSFSLFSPFSFSLTPNSPPPPQNTTHTHTHTHTQNRMIGPIWTVELYRLNTTGTPLFLCASAVMIFGTVAGVCMPSIPRNNFLRSGSRDHENHSDSRG